MHGSTMIYLFVVPIALALGVYFVPLQVGAAEIAGPAWRCRAGGCSSLGGVAMWLGLLTQDGAGDAGWTGLRPAVGRDQHARRAAWTCGSSA